MGDASDMTPMTDEELALWTESLDEFRQGPWHCWGDATEVPAVEVGLCLHGEATAFRPAPRPSALGVLVRDGRGRVVRGWWWGVSDDAAALLPPTLDPDFFPDLEELPAAA